MIKCIRFCLVSVFLLQLSACRKEIAATERIVEVNPYAKFIAGEWVFERKDYEEYIEGRLVDSYSVTNGPKQNQPDTIIYTENLLFTEIFSAKNLRFKGEFTISGTQLVHRYTDSDSKSEIGYSLGVNDLILQFEFVKNNGSFTNKGVTRVYYKR